MMTAVFRRLSQGDRHILCPDRKISLHAIANRQPITRRKCRSRITAGYSQIQPALARPDLGNVTHRFLVWLIRRKIMIQQVWRNVELVIADHHIAPLHSALFWQDRYSGNFQMGDTNVCST